MAAHWARVQNLLGPLPSVMPRVTASSTSAASLALMGRLARAACIFSARRISCSSVSFSMSMSSSSMGVLNSVCSAFRRRVRPARGLPPDRLYRIIASQIWGRERPLHSVRRHPVPQLKVKEMRASRWLALSWAVSGQLAGSSTASANRWQSATSMASASAWVMVWPSFTSGP